MHTTPGRPATSRTYATAEAGSWKVQRAAGGGGSRRQRRRLCAGIVRDRFDRSVVRSRGLPRGVNQGPCGTHRSKGHALASDGTTRPSASHRDFFSTQNHKVARFQPIRAQHSHLEKNERTTAPAAAGIGRLRPLALHSAGEGEGVDALALAPSGQGLHRMAEALARTARWPNAPDHSSVASRCPSGRVRASRLPDALARRRQPIEASTPAAAHSTVRLPVDAFGLTPPQSQHMTHHATHRVPSKQGGALGWSRVNRPTNRPGAGLARGRHPPSEDGPR